MEYLCEFDIYFRENKKSRRKPIPIYRDLLASAYSLTGRPTDGRATLYLVFRELQSKSV